MQSFLSAYSTYIFDFDGTLSSSAADVIAAMHEALASEGIVGVSIEDTAIGPPIADMFRALVPGLPDTRIENLVHKYREAYNAAGTPHTALYPGIPHVMERLENRGARMCVATNKSKSSAIPILERLGVIGRFSAIMCGDSLFPEKGRLLSKAEMIRRILDEFGVEPDDAVMIGDSAYDIEGGHEAGVHTLGVLYGYGRPEVILAARPEAVVTSADWAVFLE